MFRLAPGSTRGLRDVEAFLDLLNTLDRHPLPGARGLFDPSREIVVARAPGRLDVMGGIADYSGSLVLQLPIREATFAAVQRDPERRLRIVSLGAEGRPAFEMPLSDLEHPGGTGVPPLPGGGRPIDYAAARTCFQRDPARRWAGYAAGVFLVLMRERGAVFPQGARILIASDVPEGKGVSSSAALEVAVMQAVAAAFDIALPPRELALLCQKAENLVVGAPCGVMDQMTAACGEEGRLLALLCRPAELQAPVAIPDGVAFWGIDSGIRHAVSGSDYTSVRVGAFMGYRMIAEAAGLRVTPGGRGEPAAIDDPRWGGYLTGLTPEEFESQFAARLPERMAGAEFLDRFHGMHDPVTRVDPARVYAVRTPTAHPIREHARVREFRRLLEADGAVDDARLEALGRLMVESHASYSACGLGSDGTDRLVERVLHAVGGTSGADSAASRPELPPPPGGSGAPRVAPTTSSLFGAKITGGGSGGTVAVLGRPGADAAVEEIAARYAQESGRRPYVFKGSSPGSAAFGVVRLKPT